MTCPMLRNINVCRLRPDYYAIYRGDCVLIANTHGRIGRGEEGFYLHRTRFLSRLLLKIDGQEPSLVSANEVERHSLITYYLHPSPAGAAAGPPSAEGGTGTGGEIAAKAIEIQLSSVVGKGFCQDIDITNHGMAEAELVLSWDVAADFADQIQAASGGPTQEPVTPQRTPREDCFELVFQDRRPELHHGAFLRFHGSPDFSEGERESTVSCRLTLRPREQRRLRLELAPMFLGKVVEPDQGTAAEQARAEWLADCTRARLANTVVQAAWDRAISDLASLQLLEGNGPERFTPAAGVPKYTGLFGRDTLVTGWQSSLLTPATLRGALRRISRWNAQVYDDRYDAQPGKVLHQHQLDPLALLGKTPFLHYYGDYSAPALFLLGTAWDLAQTGDTAFFRSMLDKLQGTLDWMDRDGDLDGDGFYEYRTLAGDAGLKNQGWKDSEQAILHADGRMVPDPIAVCEIQAMYYAAKQALALAFGAIGEQARAGELLAQAEALKQRFNQSFWMPEEQYFALALDPQKQQVKSVASNPGACLAYGIVDADKAAAVARRLIAPDMFSGWAIRTLSSEHPAYNPFAYHLGAAWPSPNAIAGYGLKRYGFNAALHTLAKGLFDASLLFEHQSLPEAFGGHARDARHPHPGIYPGACAPQAWSAGAVILLLHAMLGIMPVAPLDTLIIDPDLPEWLPQVTLEAFRIGQRRVALEFQRDSTGYTHHRLLGDASGLRIYRPPPQKPDEAQPQDRLAVAMRTVLARSRNGGS